MIRKTPKPPTTRRSFTDLWVELDYLCKKVHYWLHVRKIKAGAYRYRARLAQAVRRLPENKMAILREEACALLHELQGRLEKSIAHRRREIELMERLHDEANSSRYSASAREYMLRDRDTEVLNERRAILSSLERLEAGSVVH